MTYQSGTALEVFKCPGCGDDIEVDDPIMLLDDDWVCVPCWERA
jgi:hypothetical protein